MCSGSVVVGCQKWAEGWAMSTREQCRPTFGTLRGFSTGVWSRSPAHTRAIFNGLVSAGQIEGRRLRPIAPIRGRGLRSEGPCEQAITGKQQDRSLDARNSLAILPFLSP